MSILDSESEHSHEPPSEHSQLQISMQKQHFLDFLSDRRNRPVPFFLFFDRTDLAEELELFSDRAGECDRDRDSDTGTVTVVGFDEDVDFKSEDEEDEKLTDSLSSLFFFFLLFDD